MDENQKLAAKVKEWIADKCSVLTCGCGKRDWIIGGTLAIPVEPLVVFTPQQPLVEHPGFPAIKVRLIPVSCRHCRVVLFLDADHSDWR